LGRVAGSLIYGELVAQGEVLEGELAVAAAEEGEEMKQVEQEGDHRAGIVSGSEQTDQLLGCRTGFCRRTGSGEEDQSPNVFRPTGVAEERFLEGSFRECRGADRHTRGTDE